MKANAQAKRGYSCEGRPDCAQVCIALVVTLEGLPLAYEVFDGHRADVTTVEDVSKLLREKYGRERRTWVMDRGTVSEENLEKLRAAGAHYLVGTPKGMLKRFEQRLLDKDWEEVEPGVEVKLCCAPVGGILWPLAWLWVYTRPVSHMMAYGTDVHAGRMFLASVALVIPWPISNAEWAGAAMREQSRSQPQSPMPWSAWDTCVLIRFCRRDFSPGTAQVNAASMPLDISRDSSKFRCRRYFLSCPLRFSTRSKQLRSVALWPCFSCPKTWHSNC